METKAYPFRIKTPSHTKVAKINADSYSNALNKVLSLHPGKIVKTRFALNVDGYQYPVKVDGTSAIIVKTKPYKLILNTMDLITAKVEAAKESRLQRKKMYIIVDEEEECILSSLPAKKKGNVTLTAFVNGGEVPLNNVEDVVEQENETPKNENKLKTKNQKVMSTETESPVKKVKAAKKAAKKVVATKKSAAAPAKKEVAAKVELKPAKGQKTMSIKAVIAAVNKGAKAFNVAGKPLPIGYLNKMVDPAKEIIVSIVEAA